jgi:hypothetical protein
MKLFETKINKKDAKVITEVIEFATSLSALILNARPTGGKLLL